MEKTLKYWVIGTLIVSGLALFKFINLGAYGEVNYLNNIFILIIEVLVSLFVFGVSIYVAYKVMFGKKALGISDVQEVHAV